MKTTAKFAIVLCIIFVCGLAIGGIGFLLGGMGSYQHWPTWWGNNQAQAEFIPSSGNEETMVFSDVRGVNINVFACDVTFEPGDQWELRYRLPSKESIKRLEVDNNQVLQMSTNYPKVNLGMHRERGSVTLTYPRGEKLDHVGLSTASGHIKVTDVETQAIQLSGVSGSVKATRIICTDSFDMTTVSGKLIGESIQASDMEIASTSGDILLSAIQVTELTCTAVSGNIRAKGNMSDAEISTVSGEVELASGLELSGNINTISGDVVVEALTDNFECDTVSGDVRVNGHDQKKTYSGSQSPRLDISTVSGDMDLKYTA